MDKPPIPPLNPQIDAIEMPSPVSIPQVLSMPSPDLSIPSPQLPTYNRDEASQLIAGISELVASIHELVSANIKQVNDTCQQSLSQCHALVTGSLGLCCDNAENALTKGHVKVRKVAQGGLGDAYGYAASGGLVYPTQDNVLYGLQTGDCLNSMGCAPPGEPQIEFVQQFAGQDKPPELIPVQPRPVREGVLANPPQPPRVIVNEQVQQPTGRLVSGPTYNYAPQDTQIGVAVNQQAQENISAPTINQLQNNVTEGEKCPAPNVNIKVDDTGLADAIKALAAALKPVIPVSQPIEINVPLEKPVVTTIYNPSITVTPATVTVPVNISESQPAPTTETPEKPINNIIIDITNPPPPPPPTTQPQPELNINEIAEGLVPPRPRIGMDSCTSTVDWVANFGEYIVSLLNFYRDGETDVWPSWAYEAFKGLPGTVSEVIFDFFKAASDAIKGGAKTLAAFRGCENNVQIGGVLINIMLGIINRFAGGLLKPNLERLNQGLNVNCPTHLPSTADATKAYINNTISKEQWLCWVAANNDIPESQWPILSADAQKITEDQALVLYRWGKLSPEYFGELMRSRGWFDKNQIAAYIKSSEAIPTPSDLVTMMVRDVADPSVVDAYNLLDDFDNKWKGQLKEFGDAQGLSPEISKLHWAAHWQHPSPEQVFRMMRQLNPDDPNIKALDDEFRAAYAASGKSYPGIGTTIQDVVKLLEVNDYAWFWRARLAAISYNPLTRTDAQRAFQIGTLTEEQLYWTYRHEGYNDTNSKILVNFTKELVKQRKERALGTGNISKWRTMFVQGLISYAELENAANLLIPNKDKRDRALALATDEKKVVQRKQSIDCIKHDVINGIIDNVQGQNRLINMGIDAADALSWVDNWVCKIKYRKRELTAAKICELRELGLITFQDQMERLINLGWTVSDAQLIAKKCDSDISVRQQKRIIAALRQQQSAKEKADKAAAAAQKQAEKELKDAQKQAAKDLKAQQQQQKKGGTQVPKNQP